MTSADHYDSDQVLDSILTAAEAEELDRAQAGLNLDAGLTAITQGTSRTHVPPPDAEDSGEPHILTESGNRPESPQIGPSRRRSQHCVLFAVDVAGFGDPYRDNDVQLYLRQALYKVLTSAFEDTQLGWDRCHSEDRGDGVLVLIRAETPSATIIGPLVNRLHAGLQRHNQLVRDVAKIRLRVAVHSGPVHFDDHGVSGTALIHLFRLLDAPVLKKALTQSSLDLALIVSDYFYETVIQLGPSVIDPDTFQPTTVRVKETRARGWLHLPQSPPHLPQPPPRQPQPQHSDICDICDTPWSATDPTIAPKTEQNLAGALATPEIFPFRWVR